MGKRYQDRFDGDNSPHPEDKVDWSDLGQVVEEWEAAKIEIRSRLSSEGSRPDGENIKDTAQEVCCERELPQVWVDILVVALQRA
jgi:hypothetical protein